MVQTGPKTCEGGVQRGLCRPAYHAETERRVAAPPTAAAAATAAAYLNLRTPRGYAAPNIEQTDRTRFRSRDHRLPAGVRYDDCGR
jgi:hypothetical protein